MLCYCEDHGFCLVAQSVWQQMMGANGSVGIMLTVGSVDRYVDRYIGRRSGRHSVDTRSTLDRHSIDTRSTVDRHSVDTRWIVGG